MAQTKPKAGQFYGVSGDGTSGQILTSDGSGGMSWASGTEGDLTAITVSDGVTGTSLSGPIPDLSLADNGVTNAKLGVEYTDSAALVSGATIAVDTDTADIFTYTSGVNNTLNFTDVVIGAMKNFVITGGGSSYTVTLGTSNGSACTYNKISGDYDDTSSTKNLVQIKWIAVNEAWYTINQPA